MAGGQTLEGRAWKGCDHARGFETTFFRDRLDEIPCDYVNLIPNIDGCVIEVGIHGDSKVSRKRPRRSCPDQHENRLALSVDFRDRRGTVLLKLEYLIVRQREFHIDRRTGVLFILDLGFGERGLIMYAPVNG